MELKGSQFARVASAGAVVLSLIFVGWEIRQNTVSQRGETRQALADASRELLQMIAADPSLIEAYQQIYAPPGTGRRYRELTPTDTARAGLVMFVNIRNLENVYKQFLEGVVDQTVLDTYSFTQTRFQTENFRQFWRRWSSGFDPRFVAGFEEANGLR